MNQKDETETETELMVDLAVTTRHGMRILSIPEFLMPSNKALRGVNIYWRYSQLVSETEVLTFLDSKADSTTLARIIAYFIDFAKWIFIGRKVVNDDDPYFFSAEERQIFKTILELAKEPTNAYNIQNKLLDLGIDPI